MMFHSHPLQASPAFSLFSSSFQTSNSSKIGKSFTERTNIHQEKAPIEIFFRKFQFTFHSVHASFSFIFRRFSFALFGCCFHSLCKWFMICGVRKSNYMPETNRESDQAEHCLCVTVRVCMNSPNEL